MSIYIYRQNILIIHVPLVHKAAQMWIVRSPIIWDKWLQHIYFVNMSLQWIINYPWWLVGMYVSFVDWWDVMGVVGGVLQFMMIQLEFVTAEAPVDQTWEGALTWKGGTGISSGQDTLFMPLPLLFSSPVTTWFSFWSPPLWVKNKKLSLTASKEICQKFKEFSALQP